MNTAKKTHPKTCICARCEDERRKVKRRARDARRRDRKAGKGLGALLGGGRAKPWVVPPGVSSVLVIGHGGGGGGGGGAEPPLRLDFGHAVRRDLEALHRTGLFGRTVEKVAEGLLLAELRRLVLEGWTNGVVTKIPGPMEAELDRMREGVRRGVERAVRRGKKATAKTARKGRP